MERQAFRILAIIVAVALGAGAGLCLFHGGDIHTGGDHACLSAVAILAVTLTLVSQPPTRVALAGPLARSFVTLDLTAPPPRG